MVHPPLFYFFDNEDNITPVLLVNSHQAILIKHLYSQAI